MYELQTLGSVGIRMSDGAVSTAMIVQPKRLALLIYLAMAPVRRLRRRGQILALLWPELDETHARGALSQGLRHLRLALGEGVVLTRGEDEVGIAGAVLQCDAAQLRQLVAEGEFEEAVALYRGSFLDGFHLGDSNSAFEDWVSDERGAAQQRVLDSLAGLTKGAADAKDWRRAVELTRRSLSITPDNEALVAELIRFLGMTGDRAGAFAEYRRHRERMRTDFEIGPSVAVTDALRSIGFDQL